MLSLAFELDRLRGKTSELVSIILQIKESWMPRNILLKQTDGAADCACLTAGNDTGNVASLACYVA
jgi:hypothetical protein